jgi:hypothetical protein
MSERTLDDVRHVVDDHLRRAAEARLHHTPVTDLQADTWLRIAAQTIVVAATRSLAQPTTEHATTGRVFVRGPHRRHVVACARRVVDAFELVDTSVIRSASDLVRLRGYRSDVEPLTSFGQGVVDQLEITVNHWWRQHPTRGDVPPLDAYRLRRAFTTGYVDQLVASIRQIVGNHCDEQTTLRLRRRLASIRST